MSNQFRQRGERLPRVRTDIQRGLRIASRGLPVAHIRSMEQVVGESTAQTSFNTLLFAIFASLATLLAAIGIYGLMSYAVGQRSTAMANAARGAKSSQTFPFGR